MNSDQSRRLDVRALLPLALGLYAEYGDKLSLATLADLKLRARRALTHDPMDSLLAMSLVGALLLHAAEKDHNPRCRTFLDALLFVTANQAVGFNGWLPVTDAGKAVGAFVQTFGPALSAAALSPPNAEGREQEERDINRAMLSRLDAILDVLRSRPAPSRQD
ncbi:hypothetical protein [Chondromyces crocatus]|uniref:Uncharacterized protein n=1 Tax=Chondromyces crocatus TaxID=52 RepID=A0A0K1ESJ5_CHOCO|nr:hypothetical protein [Chondromyces crocatus]AKT43841.1 uncharacterized protein CMC5_080780 [Chondromyces crocatus]